MVIVAELEGSIVGVAGLHGHKGRRLHAADLGMSDHDDYRRRGIGKALIEAADRWLGISRLELTVFTTRRRSASTARRVSSPRES